MKKLDSVTRPSEIYLSPAVKTVILGCEGVLCNSKFENNTHEGFGKDAYFGNFAWD